MELETVTAIKEVVGLFLKTLEEADKLSEAQSTLSDLVAKSDQQITREIKSAYEAIAVSSRSNNKETKDVQLRFAEECLLRNTNLNPSLKTEDVANTYLMALSYYGLAYINCQRADFPTAVDYLLKVFITDPRAARTKLLPSLYEKIFQPGCVDIYDGHVKDLELLEKKSFRLHVAGGKASAVGFLFVNLVVGSLTGAGSLVGATFPKTVEIWRDFTPEKLRAEARAKIDADFESKLDERSRKIAEARLSNRPAAFPPASPPALT